MAKDFGNLFTLFALIGLLIFGLISFGYNFQQENDMVNTIRDDDRINKTYIDLNSSLSDFRNKAELRKGSFENESATESSGSLILFTITSAGKVFTGMITGVYNVLIVLPALILGIDPIIISVFTALLLVTLVLSLWRLYRQGG